MGAVAPKACLIAAGRYLHVEQKIRPALPRGEIVVCDRYVASSLRSRRWTASRAMWCRS
ncbi:dTMP kinase [Streptomyces sp. NRRL B-3648]|uniref:dTMP kinase n=1 Tax=Streptomyces sp. NRRL B-3648 TaxID=1519493 RepID=UPI00099DB5CB|nr:hypothetical protein [Streptomyces sp. NRRL B-3648]